MMFPLEPARVLSAASEVDFTWGNWPSLKEVQFEFFNVSQASWPGQLSSQFSTNNGSSYDSSANYKYNAISKWRYYSLDGSHNPPNPPYEPIIRAHLSATSSNVTGDATEYQVPYDTRDADLWHNLNITTSKGTFTAQQTGLYEIKGHTHFLGTTGMGRVETRVITSDGQAVRVGSDMTLSAISFSENGIDFCGSVWLAAGATFYVAHKISGGTKTVSIYGADVNFTWISINIIGNQNAGFTPLPSVTNGTCFPVVTDFADDVHYGTSGRFTIRTAGSIASQAVHSSYTSSMVKTDGGNDISMTDYRGIYIGASGSPVNGVRFFMAGATPAPTISGMIKAYGVF